MSRIQRLAETPSMKRQTLIIETSPAIIENLDVFRASPFEFNVTADTMNCTETVGQVFIVPSTLGLE